MTIDTQTLLVIVGATAAVSTLSTLSAAFLFWVFSQLDSRLGSIARDLGHAPALPVPPTPPAPGKLPQAPASAPRTVTLTGKVSWFGGPDDKGVAPDEGLALYERSEAGKIAGFLLPEQPAASTGLARQLDPSSLYIACRWDYGQTPRAFLQAANVRVTANGKTIVCRPVDWGPNVNTRRIADLSPGALKALGLKTDDAATVTYPLPVSGISNQGSGIKTETGEPPWLTWARGEIGFHETGNNQGIQKYVSLAHCGAEGDPWCAIFANAALEASGVPGTRSALAESFASHPGFTELATPIAGALAVFWRGAKDSGTGHVGFYTGETATHVNVLGGNESDQVMIEALPKASASFGLIGYRWPASVPHQSDAGEPKVT